MIRVTFREPISLTDADRLTRGVSPSTLTFQPGVYTMERAEVDRGGRRVPWLVLLDSAVGAAAGWLASHPAVTIHAEKTRTAGAPRAA